MLHMRKAKYYAILLLADRLNQPLSSKTGVSPKPSNVFISHLMRLTNLGLRSSSPSMMGLRFGYYIQFTVSA